MGVRNGSRAAQTLRTEAVPGVPRGAAPPALLAGGASPAAGSRPGPERHGSPGPRVRTRRPPPRGLGAPRRPRPDVPRPDAPRPAGPAHHDRAPFRIGGGSARHLRRGPRRRSWLIAGTLAAGVAVVLAGSAFAAARSEPTDAQPVPPAESVPSPTTPAAGPADVSVDPPPPATDPATDREADPARDQRTGPSPAAGPTAAPAPAAPSAGPAADRRARAVRAGTGRGRDARFGDRLRRQRPRLVGLDVGLVPARGNPGRRRPAGRLRPDPRRPGPRAFHAAADRPNGPMRTPAPDAEVASQQRPDRTAGFRRGPP